MQTKIFDTWEKKVCYIDEAEFSDLVEKWKLKITNEYPNRRYKACWDVDYILMKPEDWTIEVSEKEKCLWQKYKYCIHSKIWRFPDEPIARYKKVNIWYRWMITRYKVEFDEWIWFEENWWSANIYTNDRNWLRRMKMQESWFKVVDID